MIESSIEKRATDYATIPAQIRGFGEDIPEEFDGEMYGEYIRIATEQDTISRKEERERCIKLACDAHCLLCPIYNRCELIENDTIGFDTLDEVRCYDRVTIRKVMEGDKI